MSNTEAIAEEGKVVLFHYTLTNDAGEILDASRGEPMPYLHGSQNIVPGLEREIAGHRAGDKFKVRVAPEDGYGLPEGPGPQPVPMSAFPEGAELSAGMPFYAENQQGDTMVLFVQRLEGDQVFVDTNHPLAGVALNFSVEIAGIRDATAAEMEHGHPHGLTGHEGHGH